MDFKTSKGTDGDSKQALTGEKGKQNGLLILLLILVAGFGYIYFFTDLIKPSQEQKPAENIAAPQVVKKPLPSPDGKPAKAEPSDAVAKKDEPPAKSEPAQVAAAPAPAPAPAPPAKPAKPVEPAPAKAKEVEKKVDALQPAVKKPLPSASAKPAAAEKKQPAPADKKVAAAKEGDKKPADAKKTVEKSVEKPVKVTAQPKKDTPKPVKDSATAVSAAAPTKAGWTVLVGNYVLEEAMAADLAKVRNAGLEAFVVPSSPKRTQMTRLLLAEFTDRASAKAELDKLKRHTSDAFILDNAGLHIVYAGSYMLAARAASEKERLTAAGFGLTLQRTAVSIPSKNITAGTFADKAVADAAVGKLRAAGVKASLTR